MKQSAFELPDFLKVGELDEAAKDERENLTNFLTMVCRCILQTSLYTKEHPAARQGVDKTFQALRKLGGRWEEFTFITSTWKHEAEGVAIEGVFTDAVELADILVGTAGEHFQAKLHGFMKRNRMISFSIKNTIKAEEFHNFVQIFVAIHLDEETTALMKEYGQDAKGPSFTDKLLASGVVNVPVVMESDMLEARRRIPWRVRVALSRLRKDLRLIPIYSKSTDTELQEAKLRLLRDILRPLRKGSHLKDLFLNLDLIQSAVEELTDLDMEPDLIEALSEPRLLSLGTELVSECDRVEADELAADELARGDELKATVRRQLEVLGMRLASLESATQGEQIVTMLRSLYLKEIVPLTVLPMRMQQLVSMERWTTSFLADADAFLSLFEEIESEAAYMQHLPNLVAIFPNLIRLKKYAESNRIIDLLKRHRDDKEGFRGRAQLVTSALEGLDNEEVIRLLVDAARTEPADVREVINGLFVAMGTAAIPPLVQVLEQSTREEILNETGLTLSAMGKEAIPHLIAILEGGALKRNTARSIITVLSQVGDAETAAVIERYARHPQSGVREAALQALYNMGARDAVPILIAAMDDDESLVSLRAIHLLQRLESRHRPYVMKLIDLMNPEDAKTEVEPQVTIAAIKALGQVGNVSMGDLGTIEELLLDCFDRHGKNRVLALLSRGRSEGRARIRAALCETLVLFGGELSLERMEDTRDEPSPIVREQMRQAVKALEERLDGADAAAG